MLKCSGPPRCPIFEQADRVSRLAIAADLVVVWIPLVFKARRFSGAHPVDFENFLAVLPVQKQVNSSLMPRPPTYAKNLPIALSHTLQLVLLFNRVAVTTSLCRVDQLFCQTFRHTLDISECRLARTDC